MKLKLMINCSEAAHYCDKAQYCEANTWERIMMRIHQRICRLCREHSLRNSKLTQLIKDAQLKSLSADEKKKIKDKLAQERRS